MTDLPYSYSRSPIYNEMNLNDNWNALMEDFIWREDEFHEKTVSWWQLYGYWWHPTLS